jgi:hypothetical protein
MDKLQRDIRAAFARQQGGVGNTDGAQARLLHRAFSTGAIRPKLLPQLARGVATLLVAGAVAVAVLLTHNHFRQTPVTPAKGIEEALLAGPASAMGPVPDHAFVWFTGLITEPPQGSDSNQGGLVTGVTVEVLDWTGKVRYHFELPHSTPPGGVNEIQAISADGTRALLDDGTVLDETGAAIGKIPSLRSNGPTQSRPRWMSNDRGVCAALSNEPVSPNVQMPPKGQPNPSPTSLPPYALPGADHSVTLKVFGLDGSVRTIATVGSGPLTVPSGVFPDSTSVLACNPTTDLAVVARYHDADNTPADSQSTTNMTVSLWAIKLSTGAILFHQPETRMALGRAFFFGSENGKLAVEFLWNSKVWGSETDVVLQLPSGQQVPVRDTEPIPDTPGLSADGTRILRRLVEKGGNQTALELIDAADGRIIRRVEIPALVGVSAVAQPGGSSFMVQVEGYLALVDGNGGISLLHPAVNLTGPGSVGLQAKPGLQG